MAAGVEAISSSSSFLSSTSRGRGEAERVVYGVGKLFPSSSLVGRGVGSVIGGLA